MTVRTLSRLAGALVLCVATAWLGCAGSSDQDAEGSSTGSEFREAPRGKGDSSSLESKSLGLQAIYFDYDRFEIRADAKPALRENADAINGLDLATVTVEGHCDERGSPEYNLALGEKRANAVKRYLVDLGVSSARLRTVSFGEDRPAVQGHDESAWRYNRRAEFVR